jgi:hypothetical protein
MDKKSLIEIYVQMNDSWEDTIGKPLGKPVEIPPTPREVGLGISFGVGGSVALLTGIYCGVFAIEMKHPILGTTALVSGAILGLFGLWQCFKRLTPRKV